MRPDAFVIGDAPVKCQGEGFWRDGPGVVHIVGRHIRQSAFTTIYADCETVIAKLNGHVEGFYYGNTDDPPTCLLCLDASNFGTYRPKQ